MSETGTDTATGFWQVVTLTESGTLEEIERAVGELALSHSVFRAGDGRRWRVEAICDHAPAEWPLPGETTVAPLEASALIPSHAPVLLLMS